MQGGDADEDIEILERASQGEEVEGDVLEKFYEAKSTSHGKGKIYTACLRCGQGCTKRSKRSKSPSRSVPFCKRC